VRTAQLYGRAPASYRERVVDVKNEWELLWRATRRSLHHYRDWDVLSRIVVDVAICGVLLLGWFWIGGQATWTAPYYGAVMVAWVMSDFASNLLITPSDRAAKAIHLSQNVRRTLFAENLALAVWLFPFGALGSAIACGYLHRWDVFVCAVVAVACVLGSWLGVGDIISVLYARQPEGLSVLKGGPARWRTEVKRGLAYFGTMFVIGPVVSLPAFVAFYFALYHWGLLRWWALVCAILWSFAVWVVGWFVAVSLAQQRRDVITSVLHHHYREEDRA